MNNRKLVAVAAGLILAVGMTSASALNNADAQQGASQHRYAALAGDYEFDLSSIGMGVVVVNVYIEGDDLWIWPESSGEPAKMTAVEGESFKFYVDDDEEGHYEIEFLKDDAGAYTKCRVVNDTMGLDATGSKIKK